MIKYSLRCDEGHAFESWFKSSDAYEKLQAAGALACPVCGSSSVTKAVMAPAVARGAGRVEARRAAQDEARRETTPAAAPTPPAEMLRQAAQTRRVVQALRRHVETHFDHVGDQFAAEARKIHRGDAEKRDIYGSATADEVRDLRDDGVPFAALPPSAKENA